MASPLTSEFAFQFRLEDIVDGSITEPSHQIPDGTLALSRYVGVIVEN